MRSALGVYALSVLLGVPPLLRRRRWVDREPRLGILAWQAAGLALLSSLALLAVLTLAPVTDVRLDLVHLMHACRAVLTSHDSAAVDVALIAGGLAVLAVVFRIGWRQARATTRARRQQRVLIDLLTTPLRGSVPRARLLEHETPLAYCVPGRRSRIVVTTGARDALAPDGLEVVLRHEQAHLRGRHHLVLLWSRVLGTALPLPVFRTADSETAQLVEMLADDAVPNPADRRLLAHAVLALGGPSPVGALAAGDTGAQRRVARLLRDPPALSRAGRWAAVGFSVALVALPWLSVTPALAAWSGQCQPPA